MSLGLFNDYIINQIYFKIFWPITCTVKYHVGIFYPGNTHQNLVGAGSLQKEEGGDEIIGWLGVICKSGVEVTQAILAWNLPHQDGFTLDINLRECFDSRGMIR